MWESGKQRAWTKPDASWAATNECCQCPEPPSSSRSPNTGGIEEAAQAEDEHRHIHERLERGGRAVHSVAQPTEALEPAERPLDHIAFSLQRGLFGVQLTDGLLRRDARPRRDQRPEAVIVDKLPESPAVVPLIGQ
jgi:hypothetical protein